MKWILVDILAALGFVAVFVVVSRDLIRRFPLAFYAGAALLDALLWYAYTHPVPLAIWNYLLVFLQRGLFAHALLVIIMFIGVLSPKSAVRRHLLPIRAELSVIFAVLVAGHAAPHLPFLGRVLSHPLASPISRVASFLISAVLLALLTPLAVTSIRRVRRTLSARTWKSIQSLAYPFFLLIYAHLVLVLLEPARVGATRAAVSIAVYVVVFLSYAVLRIRRALRDRAIALADLRSTPLLRNGGDEDVAA